MAMMVRQASCSQGLSLACTPQHVDSCSLYTQASVCMHCQNTLHMIFSCFLLLLHSECVPWHQVQKLNWTSYAAVIWLWGPLLLKTALCNVQVTGEIIIAEFASANDPEEYEWSVSAEGTGTAQDKLKGQVDTLRRSVFEKLEQYASALNTLV